MSSQPATPAWAAFARNIIELLARDADPGRAIPPAFEPRPHGGVFVTLRKLSQLRGCMGILDPSMSLPEAIRQAAISAASQDPRFPPVQPNELPHIRIEVSIMSAPQPMGSLDDLVIGRHGVLVQHGSQRGLFLPQVAVDHHLEKEAFLSRCCSEKAGLAPDAWRKPDTDVLLFQTEVFQED